MATIFCPDISHWHPVRNWSEVKKHCPFIISKATQGTNYIDPTLGSFVANCENLSIPYWTYTFLNVGREQAQAEFLVRVMEQRMKKNSKNFIGYAIDNESGSSAKGVQTALNWLNRQGFKTMLYTMYAEYSKYKGVIADRGSNCAWWEARYGANSGYDTSNTYPCHSGVDLHQYTSRGYVPGIGYNIDLNRLVNKPLTWFTTQKSGNTTHKETTPAGSTLDLVYNVMLNKYGSGEQRKKALANRYREVQDFINHINNASDETLAQEVKNGIYGDNPIRKTVLGKRYAKVQKLVNKML